jgi:hypothetical protein
MMQSGLVLAATAVLGMAAFGGIAACGAEVAVFGAPATVTSSGNSGGGGSGGSEGTGGDVTTGPGSTGSGQPAMLACGDSSCPVGEDSACCWDDKNFHGQPQAECVTGDPDEDNCATSEDNPPGAETRIECQQPSHCEAGEVCCGERHSQMGVGTWYSETVCADDCDWPDIQLCEPGYVCPTIETMGGPVQLVCKPSQLLPPGYMVCGFPDGG